jgi:general secretion pathway protein K
MRRRRESGVAAITAVLIVAVAASAAAVMLAQQSATLDQALLVAARAQADEYAHAGVDWARGVLSQDAQAGQVDSLADGWAQPIAALPVERAVVSGEIADEQGKFNLNNLVVGNHRSDEDVAIFGRLLAAQGLAPELADAVVDWIDGDDALASGAGAEDAYYLSLPQPYRAANRPMVQVEELYRVKGFDAAAVAKLLPYVTALPSRTRTAINANTAAAAVLAAVLPTVPREAIEREVAERSKKPFRTEAEVAQWVASVDRKASAAGLAVKSGFFTVRVRVAQDDVELGTEALLERTALPGKPVSTAIVWRRPFY